MTLASTSGVVHLPFGERPQYGSPFPEGLAVAANFDTDDASAGIHTFSILAPRGFLYRLELLNLTRGAILIEVCHFITRHDWATAKGSAIAGAFNLNWGLGQSLFNTEGGGGFTIYTPMGGIAQTSAHDIVPRIRRFPMGSFRGDPGVDQQLLFVTIEDNVDTVTNELAIVMTYWRKEATYFPGFLSSFFESPFVPSASFAR